MLYLSTYMKTFVVCYSKKNPEGLCFRLAYHFKIHLQCWRLCIFSFLFWPWQIWTLFYGLHFDAGNLRGVSGLVTNANPNNGLAFGQFFSIFHSNLDQTTLDSLWTWPYLDFALGWFHR